MKCLAIETSSAACSVALSLDDKIYTSHTIAPMLQSQLLLPMIDELLSSNNIILNQLDTIAFGCGPGSFTGIRIATSVAQGLAYGAKLPIIPISSLAALAQTTYQEKGWEKILVAVDARIHEVYWAAYKVNHEGLMTLYDKEYLGKPIDILSPDDETWYGSGTAWDVYKNEITYSPKDKDTILLPTAKSVILLAKEKFEKKLWVDADKIQPTYLRDNVAKKSLL